MNDCWILQEDIGTGLVILLANVGDESVPGDTCEDRISPWECRTKEGTLGGSTCLLKNKYRDNLCGACR